MLIKRLYSIFKNTFSDMDNLIAVCQITSTGNKEKNFQACKALITNAQKCGAKMVFLPESFDYIEEDKAKSLEMAESVDGSLINNYKTLAKTLNIWLSLGGFHEKFSETKLKNTHLVINNKGEIAETYHKIHLYDVQIPSKNIQAFESNLIKSGTEISPPVKTPIGNVGLAICYDMRFSQMAIALAENGAEILTYPSAFFFGTGAYHWEILLRARAIETQCYVIAAAQTGSHNSTRKSWGHSLVVDPLGTVIAQCSEEPGFVLAPIDLSLIKSIRQSMPLECHRRYDIYPKMIPSTLCRTKSIEDFDEFKFGSSIVKGLQVFYKTLLCLAFTNIKCVLPGHVLVAPLRAVEKLTDLSTNEVGDLFLTVQKVQKTIEQVHNTDSSSIVIQDGQHAGQTIKHVHVHIIPRKSGDFLVNDDVYRKLQNEKYCVDPKRSDDEMAQEAKLLRSFFNLHIGTSIGVVCNRPRSLSTAAIMNKQLDQLTDVFISDEVLLMCHNLALLTEKEEVAALLIGQKIIHENGTTVSVSALSIPPRGEIKKDRVEIMSEDLVNAMEDAKHFSRVKGANLNVIGWYHSHPHITVWPSNVDLQTQLNLQNMDSCFIGIICSSYNTDTTTMMKEMKTVCFQAKQINGMVHRIDVKFQVAPTTCTSKLSFGVIVKHIETLYDELIKNYNEANEGDISPMAQLHNDSVYTLSGIHMLETVAKPMLQMLETQRESSTKRIQSLQTKLDQLSLGINDEHYCDGTSKTYNDQENSDDSDNNLSPSVPKINQHKETKKGKNSSMVSSPV